MSSPLGPLMPVLAVKIGSGLGEEGGVLFQLQLRALFSSLEVSFKSSSCKSNTVPDKTPQAPCA